MFISFPFRFLPFPDLPPGCGLRPLYSGGSQGVASQLLGGVEVPPISGKAGWMVRNALLPVVTTF